MRSKARLFLLVTLFFLAINGCGSNQPPVTSPMVATSAEASPTQPAASLTPTTIPITITPSGETIIVTDPGDSGNGTLRAALQDAHPGDVVTFDPAIFPGEHPQTIFLQSTLPGLVQGGVTIDVRAAGVILDGSNITPGWESAIQILSDHNTIRGLTLINFSGAAIQISGGQNNLIEGNVIGNSDYSIGIWGAQASGNRITANYLGVMSDDTTPLGNKSAGILVMEAAHNNLIGPGNHIAFNGRSGIEISHAGSTGNTIFENSLHDNGTAGIAITSGGNNNLEAPLLMDFDLGNGSANGIGCSYCTILIYSDSKGEGAIFEGQSAADENGLFSFEKGSAFTGPSLTATATDLEGNTSGFSIPTAGNRRSMQFQPGNELQRAFLETSPSDALEDNHLGAIWADFWQPMDFQSAIDNEILPAGLKLVRITMNQVEYYSNEQSNVELFWDKPELFISPEFDDYIDQLIAHKITIYYTLSFWDKINHRGGWNIQNRFHSQEDICHYLEYVRFIVTKFKGRVQYYELWNEPDVGYPLQYIEPTDYVNLAKQAIPLIKQIDPQAKVVFGCTSGSANPQSRDYLFKILDPEIMPIADVIAWHPLYSNVPGKGQFPDYYAGYPSLLSSIMDTARQNGFKGEFLAGEISYGGPECGGCDVTDPAYTENIWAKYTARGIILHFGSSAAVTVGGMSSQRTVQYNTIRNIANIFSGVRADRFPLEIQTDSTNYQAFTFAGTGGSRLIAVWTDGLAVDIDAGIASTIKIPGYSDWKATAIDILDGFEEQLVTKSENGDLLVPNFLIKDYPLIIRLSK
jgi:hypothetical protein